MADEDADLAAMADDAVNDPPPANGATANDDALAQARAHDATLYVGNLQWWTTDAAVERVAAEYGRLREPVFMLEDRASGKSKGVAVVRFVEPEAAARCKEGAAGRELDGRPVVVTWAEKGGAHGGGYAPPDQGVLATGQPVMGGVGAASSGGAGGMSGGGGGSAGYRPPHHHHHGGGFPPQHGQSGYPPQQQGGYGGGGRGYGGGGGRGGGGYGGGGYGGGGGPGPGGPGGGGYGGGGYPQQSPPMMQQQQQQQQQHMPPPPPPQQQQEQPPPPPPPPSRPRRFGVGSGAAAP
jgi:cleavage and polyadenylation specificity factor subunit 6/7